MAAAELPMDEEEEVEEVEEPTAVTKKAEGKKRHPELTCMNRISLELDEFDDAGKARIVNWIYSVYGKAT